MTEIPSVDLKDWYPYVVAAGVATPKTEIVETSIDLSVLLDGETPDGFEAFISRLRYAATKIGYPLFMRTGHGSGKHQYLDTCHVADDYAMPSHVASLVLWSYTVDFIGLPTSTWVLRELLPVNAPFTAFHGMPVTRERRYFIQDGEVIGHHPYWPPDAIAEGQPSVSNWRWLLDQLNAETAQEIKYLTGLTRRIAAVLPGAWSVDWLATYQGWMCIDLAHLNRSFIWHEWPTAPAIKGHEESGQEWWTVGSGSAEV